MVQGAELSREILSSPTKMKEDILTVSTRNTPENFIGGKLYNFFFTWKSITSDPWKLNTISGYQLEVTERPWQAFGPKSIKFSSLETELINLEVQNFLDKSIIEIVPSKDEDEFYSNIFIRPKMDGSVRVILNLKNVQKGDYFGSIDLKDAYFSILVAQEDRKYLRFLWNGTRYQFRTLPQG